MTSTRRVVVPEAIAEVESKRETTAAASEDTPAEATPAETIDAITNHAEATPAETIEAIAPPAITEEVVDVAPIESEAAPATASDRLPPSPNLATPATRIEPPTTIASSLPSLAANPPPATETSSRTAKLTLIGEDEVRATLGDRRWRIRGISKNTTPGSLKLDMLLAHGEDFFVDTIEVYSARHRVRFRSKPPPSWASTSSS